MAAHRANGCSRPGALAAPPLAVQAGDPDGRAAADKAAGAAADDGVTDSAPVAREILLLLPAAVLVVVAAPAGGGQRRRRSERRRRQRPENGTAGTLRDAEESHTVLHQRWDTATESFDSERWAASESDTGPACLEMELEQRD